MRLPSFGISYSSELTLIIYDMEHSMRKLLGLMRIYLTVVFVWLICIFFEYMLCLALLDQIGSKLGLLLWLAISILGAFILLLTKIMFRWLRFLSFVRKNKYRVRRNP